MTSEEVSTLGVAEAKSRFSELIDRVGRGERFLVSRRGHPALALVRPDDAPGARGRPTGLVAVAGALADWDDLAAIVDEIYASRRRARERSGPELD
ncbi:MAG: type II toxin-antitoxin system Phd/YefM family antitoxin [Candidatus Dormibacteraceae bacterium]